MGSTWPRGHATAAAVGAGKPELLHSRKVVDLPIENHAGDRRWVGRGGGIHSTHGSPEQGGRLTLFERFTDRARRVVVLAQEEARLLNHNYIGTEHILLGLIHEGEGVAAKALESLGISLEAVRSQVEEIIGQGGSSPSGHIPFTPRAKKVLELSLREALQLGHNYIGTEHILLGPHPRGRGRGRPGAGQAGRRSVPRPPAGHPAPQRLPGPRRLGREGWRHRRSRRRWPGGRIRLARARPVRSQPHPAGPREEARPRHRPLEGDRAGHAGAVPPPEEQPGPRG